MNWKVVLGILTCNVVMMSASYTMLIPFLPVYLTKELHTDPDTVNMWTGVIFAVSFAVTAVMAPIWGRMSDTHGKKFMVMRSSALIALTYVCGGLVQTPLQMFFVRVLQGFAAGLWPASLALLSAYTPKTKIGICMGIIQSANVCGGIIGPLAGGVLAEAFGMRVSFFISASILALITLITLVFIKEPPKDPAALAKAKDKKQKGPTFRTCIENPNIRILLLCTGLTNMVILLLQPIMTLYIGQLRQSDENLLLVSGLVFSLSGIASAIAAPIWGKQGQSHGFFKTEVISLFAAGLLISCQFLPNSLIPFAILQFTVGLGFSGIFPSANSMLITNTDPAERGVYFGLLFSAQQIGATIGPILGGVLATFFHLSWIFLLSGLLLIGMSVYFYFKAPHSLRTQRIGTEKKGSEKDFIEKIKQEVMEKMRQRPAQAAAVASGSATAAQTASAATATADSKEQNAAAEAAAARAFADTLAASEDKAQQEQEERK